MKCIAFCCLGIEDVLVKDIKELIDKDSKKHEGFCTFEADEKEVAKLAYLCQSIENVGILLQTGKIEDDPTSIDIKDIDFSIIKNVFSISCSINSEKPFKSIDIIVDISEKIKSITKKAFTYKNGFADTNFLIQIFDNKYFFCIDLTIKELNKRDYKVFVNKTSLRGPIAYAICRIAEVKKEDKILDCFCRSGEIPIEIVHYFVKKSVHYYAKEKFEFKKLGWDVNFDELDKVGEGEFEVYATDSNMANLRATEKNAKIAGVNKLLKYSRTNLEDLDLRFDSDVDKIITQLPALGKDNEALILKLYKQFFVILPKVVKKNAILALIGKNIERIEDFAKEHGYTKKHSRSIMQGQEELLFYIFQKK